MVGVVWAYKKGNLNTTGGRINYNLNYSNDNYNNPLYGMDESREKLGILNLFVMNLAFYSYFGDTQFAAQGQTIHGNVDAMAIMNIEGLSQKITDFYSWGWYLAEYQNFSPALEKMKEKYNGWLMKYIMNNNVDEKAIDASKEAYYEYLKRINNCVITATSIGLGLVGAVNAIPEGLAYLISLISGGYSIGTSQSAAEGLTDFGIFTNDFLAGLLQIGNKINGSGEIAKIWPIFKYLGAIKDTFQLFYSSIKPLNIKELEENPLLALTEPKKFINLINNLNNKGKKDESLQLIKTVLPESFIKIILYTNPTYFLDLMNTIASTNYDYYYSLCNNLGFNPDTILYAIIQNTQKQ